jgi:hypothetical protein
MLLFAQVVQPGTSVQQARTILSNALLVTTVEVDHPLARAHHAQLEPTLGQSQSALPPNA